MLLWVRDKRKLVAVNLRSRGVEKWLLEMSKVWWKILIQNNYLNWSSLYFSLEAIIVVVVVSHINLGRLVLIALRWCQNQPKWLNQNLWPFLSIFCFPRHRAGSSQNYAVVNNTTKKMMMMFTVDARAWMGMTQNWTGQFTLDIRSAISYTRITIKLCY